MFLERLRGRPDRDQFQVRWPVAPLRQHLAAHRGVSRLCRGKLLDEGKRLIQTRSRAGGRRRPGRGGPVHPPRSWDRCPPAERRYGARDRRRRAGSRCARSHTTRSCPSIPDSQAAGRAGDPSAAIAASKWVSCGISIKHSGWLTRGRSGGSEGQGRQMLVPGARTRSPLFARSRNICRLAWRGE
jgi:hypothetical protein